MANRVTIHIHNTDYRIVAEESEAYIQGCAALVEEALEEALKGPRISMADAAVMAAMNMADRYGKEKQTADHLRLQLKELSDENTQLAKELAEKRKEARRSARTEKTQGDD